MIVSPGTSIPAPLTMSPDMSSPLLPTRGFLQRYEAARRDPRDPPDAICGTSYESNAATRGAASPRTAWARAPAQVLSSERAERRERLDQRPLRHDQRRLGNGEQPVGT